MLLITGSSGALGIALRQALDRDGKAERAFASDRGHVDLEDVKRVEGAVLAVNPRVVFHCAALTAVDRAEEEPGLADRVNWLATRAIASACGKLSATLVYISSDYVFDGERGNYAEQDEPRPVNHYGATKLWGETETRALCPNHYIVRTSWIYSEHGRNFYSRFHDLAQGGRLNAITDQRSRPTYAPHLADALLKLADSAPFGTYHVAGGEPASPFDFLQAAAELGGGLEIHPIASADVHRKARRPKDTTLNCNVFTAFTGVTLPGYREGLERMLKARGK